MSRVPVENPVVTITTLSHEGRGITRLNGKVVFIDGVLPGEQVSIRIDRRHRRYDSASVVEVLTPSPERIEPPCPHFGVCGGCSLQHMGPATQIRIKQEALTDQLVRIGKVEPKRWLAPLIGPEWNYRRRARLGVRHIASKGATLVGFRERKSAYVTQLDTCLVLDKIVADLLPALSDLVAALSCADRLPQIEVAVGDNARAMVFRHLVPFTPDDVAKLQAFGQRHSVQMYAQDGSPDALVPLWPAQPEALFYTLPDGTTVNFRPTDFIQVNAGMNAKMIEQAMTLLDLRAEDRVLDLFAGLGNFTLPMARKTAGVLGIEGETALVEGARANATHNGIPNAEFRRANLFEESAEAPWHGFGFNKLLLDPPRIGAIEAIRQLKNALPEKIVYVSCYPATLARDAQHLVHVLGYDLSAAGVMDMFPHTSHVESMALFERHA